MLQMTSLNLRATDVADWNGLSGAENLNSIKVSSSKDIMAKEELSGVTILVDSDVDEIADAKDSCPLVANASQANLDGDGYTVAQGDSNDYDANVHPNILITDADVNGNSEINIADMLLMRSHILGLITVDANGIVRADLYPVIAGDGQLTTEDLLLLQQRVLGN